MKAWCNLYELTEKKSNHYIICNLKTFPNPPHSSSFLRIPTPRRPNNQIICYSPDEMTKFSPEGQLIFFQYLNSLLNPEIHDQCSNSHQILNSDLKLFRESDNFYNIRVQKSDILLLEMLPLSNKVRGKLDIKQSTVLQTVNTHYKLSGDITVSYTHLTLPTIYSV